MINIASNLALGILTNTVYDVAKYTGEKFANRKKDRELQEIVEQEISENIPEELSRLLESSTFVSYFNSPQFLDVLNIYIEQKIICDYACKSVNIQKHLKKGDTISMIDVIEYISQNIYNLYVQNRVAVIPPLGDIRDAVKYILHVTEEVVAKSISPETSRAIFFLNSRMDMHYQDIKSILIKLQKTSDQICAKQLSSRGSDYEEIKAKYHSVLQEKNSVAHIYLLDKFPFEKFYVPPVLNRLSVGRNSTDMLYGSHCTSWKDIFDQDNIVYLIGGAGYGKSLFTKKIINDYKELNIFRGEEYLVVCGELKAFYPAGADSAISVIEFLRGSIRSNTLMDVSPDFIEYYLNAGRCIILLDALDEVDKAKRFSLHESVIAFFRNQNPNNKVCLTSRDRGFIPEHNVEVLKICSLNEEQIGKYVDKIIALGKFEKQDKETFMKQSKILVDKGFLNSFLVLSLLINIYKAELELPENKLELYQKCFEYIANKREKEKTQKDFDWRAISPIMKDNTFMELSRLALPNNTNIDRKDIKERLLEVYKTKYNCEAEAENAIEEFLRFCSDRTELFVPSVEDKYKFFHRSFFEYFYSLYIFFRCRDEKEILEELLKFDVDSEVFELTVAMLKQKSEIKYQSLIELMFEEAEKEFCRASNEYPVFNILILTMQVIDDALYKARFLDIIIHKKPLLIKNVEHIHNLKLIATIYENDIEAYRRICDCYNDDGLVYLFKSCESFWALANKYAKDAKGDFFKAILNGNLKHQAMRRIIWRDNDEDKKFYMTLFSRMWNYRDVLLGASDEKIIGVFKKIYPRDYKKRATRVREILERMREFSELEQNKLIEIMLSSMYVYS